MERVVDTGSVRASAAKNMLKVAEQTCRATRPVPAPPPLAMPAVLQ